MYQRSRTSWLKHLDFMFLDLLCLLAAFIIGYLLRFKSFYPFSDFRYTTIFIVVLVLDFASSVFLLNLSGVVRRGWLSEFLHVSLHVLVTAALAALYLILTHVAMDASRLLFLYIILLYLVLDFLARGLYKQWVSKFLLKRNTAPGGKPVLVISSRAGLEKVITEIREDAFTHYNVIGYVLLGEEGDGEPIGGAPCAAPLAEAADYICREWIEEIFLYLPGGTEQPSELLEHCAEMGVTVHRVLEMRNASNHKQFVEGISDKTVLTTAYNYMEPYQVFLKRAMDILGGLVGTVFAVLIGICIFPFIQKQSPGPLIFKQRRVGQNGKMFYVYKFRSMCLDAEAKKKDLATDNRVSDGLMFKIEHDPRIIGNEQLPDGTWKTGIGEFIRKTSLDEFPQFFNVLKGDMSLVGTRPPTPDEWEKYQYHHRARLAVKPGITGMWQVSGRSEITDFEEVVRLDTEYICNYNTTLDFKILLRTVYVLFARKGAM